MSSTNIKLRRQRLSFVWLCALSMAAMVMMYDDRPATHAQSSETAAVPEIRFGVIDPPVVLQQDITESFTTSNAAKDAKDAKPIECAGMVFVNGRLLIVSDRHEHCLFASPFDLKKMRIATPGRVVIQPNEQYLLADAEAITVRPRDDGSFTGYIFTSQSNDRNEQPLPMRRHLARFTFPAGPGFEPTGMTVIDGTAVRETLTEHFDDLNIKPYRTFYADASTTDKNTYRWGNIEGIAFTPDGKRLLLGLRNPLTAGNKGDAIFAVLEDLDAAFDAGDAEKVKVTDIFTLYLGDRGVSDLCWDPMTKGYLIAAGKSNGPKVDKDQPFPPNTLDSALFWWSGRKSERPIQIATVPEMKIEAICRLGTSRFIAIGSDEGDESEGRPQRQSVITVMDFTGFKK